MIVTQRPFKSKCVLMLFEYQRCIDATKSKTSMSIMLVSPYQRYECEIELICFTECSETYHD